MRGLWPQDGGGRVHAGPRLHPSAPGGTDPVDATLRDDGHPARVTATALWATPLSHPEVLGDLLLALPARLDQPTAPSAPTPVVVAVADAAAATARSTPSSRLPEPGGER